MSEQLQSIIDRVALGDFKVLENVYKQEKLPFARWVIKKYRLSEEEALELFHTSVEIFIYNIRVGRLKEAKSSGVKTYLYAIAKNKMRENFREQKRSVSEEDVLLEVPVEEELLDEEKHIKLNMLKKALESLGSPCSEILRMFYYGEYSNEEIAESLKYSNTNSVKTQKYKCLKRLRALMGIK